MPVLCCGSKFIGGGESSSRFWLDCRKQKKTLCGDKGCKQLLSVSVQRWWQVWKLHRLLWTSLEKSVQDKEVHVRNKATDGVWFAGKAQS